MEDLQKRVKGFINISIIMSFFFVILGIVFLLFPQKSLDVIRWIFCILTFSVGLFMVISDFTRKNYIPFLSASAIGAVLVIIGLVFAIYPNVMSIFPMILGAWFVVNSVSSLRFNLSIRGQRTFSAAMITTFLTFICGILLVLNPWAGQAAMMVFTGIMMIVYSVSNIIDMAVLRVNLEKIEKSFKKYIAQIEK